jgi:DNA invertase Pin-like site-specific DNA recombinase
MVVYSISRIARKMWETLRFLENEISSGKIKLVVVDDPTLDEMTIGFKAMFAQHERKQIQMRTKASLSRIKAEIEEKGSYTARSGRVITKLAVQAAKADARAEEMATMLTNFRTQGLSYREIANQLNTMGVPTTKNRRNSDQSVDDRSQWHASTVRNYVKRLEQ